ncbi:hypothetical protein [Pseudorhodoplanes sp.]|uniref:hypothetical protein n=1 Tax=Pseudorhodoplanes sp. TaxID=1934341 RepID=UPI00391CD18F
MPDSEQVQAILARGVITADDILALRHRVFWKGIVTGADAELAFLLNDKLHHNADPAWPAFFVEALTDYVVTQAEPSGYVSEDNAAYLIQRIGRSGCVDTACELELLIKVLERSRQSPVSLVRFALDQVKIGVVTGAGAVGARRKCNIGAVEDHETEMVRRILYAFGGDGNIAVTQAEAEVLFDINDATDHEHNHPSWSDLYVKALANFLMAASGYRVPTRQEALRREAWLDEPPAGVPAFMGRMLEGGLKGILNAYREPDAVPDAVDRWTTPRATDAEIAWAAGRIGRHGRLHQNEMALINFLKSLDAHRHPRLVPVLDRVAA